jgi:hypothetical protein
MRVLRLAVLAASAALAACAAEVVRRPTELTAAPAPKAYVLGTSVEITLDSKYRRHLGAGTELAEIGSVREGRVLKPVNAVLTVEGAHMHEAYAVVQGDRLVGFYLPVEKSFSPLSQTLPLVLQERKTP